MKPGRSAGSGVGWTLLRHQLGSAIVTVLDFGTMTLLVECFGVSPVAATAVGASLGAVSNFLLGRAWIFRHHSGHWLGQAVRYGVVSGTSALLNVLGEHLLHNDLHVPYFRARCVVALAASLLWNFPMQRWFVFREKRVKGDVPPSSESP